MRTDLMALVKERVVLCDGAMGTRLIAEGLKPGVSAESWNVKHPDAVRQIHRSYIEVGAEAVITNSFGGNRYALTRYGEAGRVQEFNAAATLLAREAARDDALVFADVGPTGEMPPPMGNVSFSQFVKAFSEQIGALHPGADAIIIETMTCLEEAKAAVAAARDSCDLPVIACMKFNKDATRDDYHTIMGVSLQQMTEALVAAGADIIGANCITGPQEALGLVRKLRSFGSFPVIIEPNAGVPKLLKGVTVYPVGPEEMGRYAAEFVEAGANVIGGCCGTTPQHIAAMARNMRGD